MNLRTLFRVFIIIIIILGGVIIIIVKPIPEPICIVCGNGLVRLLGLAQIVLGALALRFENSFFNLKNDR
ncbi:MAG: hypothetical protein QM535_07635 [Limnohabitans sp.]|nr:hypothetical protein [Limnohabitans sp.]